MRDMRWRADEATGDEDTEANTPRESGQRGQYQLRE